MGYKLPKRTALVEFDEGHEYHGLRIELRLDIPMGLAFSFDREDVTVEQRLREFAAATLLGWNLEDDDGNPIPATADAFMQQPFAMGILLFEKWREATTGVPAPLVEPSANGKPSAEPSETTVRPSLSRVI